MSSPVSSFSEQSLIDTLIERPLSFTVKAKPFALYPPTLGKVYLLHALMHRLGISERRISLNPYAEALRLCQTQTEHVLRLLVCHTFRRRADLLNASKVEARLRFFARHLSHTDAATLLLHVISAQSAEACIRHLGLDQDREQRSRVLSVKQADDSTLTFGGRSVYGTLIDTALQRYGWSYDYVLWGISYANLTLLLADGIQHIYLSDEERKRLHSATDIIDADRPENMALIRQMLNE